MIIAATKRLLAHDGAVAALTLLFILGLCFAPVILGRKTLLESAQVPSILSRGAWTGRPLPHSGTRELDPGAPAWQTEAQLALIRHQYWRERSLPLWNPYQGYGEPLAANMQSQPFFPVSIVLSAVLGPTTYSWAILLRLFIAGIGSYFYLRLLVSHLSSLAGAITSMLGGYYLLYLTMFHISVEMLLPAGLWAMESLLRERTYRRAIWLIAILWLILMGGAPESALLVLSFVYVYLAFRLVTDAALRRRWIEISKCVLLSSIAGVALAAFLLLPFYEFLHHSFDLHQPGNLHGQMPGLDHDALDKGVLTYLFPLLLGPAQAAAGWSGIRNYTGMISVFLVIVGAASLRRNKDNTALGSLAWFYLLFAIAVPLKRYGFAGVNWIGSLPLYRLTGFPKHEEVILSISVSMLCAIAVERLIRREVSKGVQLVAFAATFLIIPVTTIYCRRTLDHPLFRGHAGRAWAIGLPAVLLCLLAGLLLRFANAQRGEDRVSAGRRLGVCLIVLLTCEASLNYIVPVYYSISRMASVSSNPYSGAPYLTVLEAQAGNDRIFARDEVLYPNWASAFQLADIRDLDAMYNARYFRFLTEFFPPPREHRVGTELFDRFTGDGAYEFDLPREQRLLQLSSVKYIASTRPFPVSNSIVEEILEQNKGRLIPGREFLISNKHVDLSGSFRESLGEHPPYERLPYRVYIREGASTFHFACALDPAAFDKGGDGVGFTVEIEDAKGKIAKAFSTYIDPKHNKEERRWMEGAIDVSHYRGQTVELLFSTDPGPRGDTSYDWAAWSDFHFDDRSENQSPFQSIYNGEARVYQYNNVLPRAAVYYHAELTRDESEVLQRLADPALDVFQTVVLDGATLSRREAERVREMDQSAPRPVEKAAITRYESQSVEIEATLDRSGVLMLNDSNYPGWQVQVDGRRGEIISADYLFRGVLLSAGKHIVRFVYRPSSFYAGAAISLAALICTAGAGLLWARR